MLACGFALTEAVVLHVQVRREARSVSLSEIPLCIGLFFAAPWALIAGRLVGSIAVWILYRRQPAIKIAFNVANSTAEIALALVVFYAVAGLWSPRRCGRMRLSCLEHPRCARGHRGDRRRRAATPGTPAARRGLPRHLPPR